ncbi:sensor domain-containing diguanylate cyclase [Paramaledivibacter caminithermalis]|jgi:diguanylate cyclase (GGDEF)-like protein|uniref:Diguanylate cyclase (GGDEF) domain-containing protein n=1 Tax=Paramaledivibacter caminithermalis (strain DSM 15212 / CIP 107654 / DViRD3) TaxID=1121301 RepID=A0A1M6RP54_PARC5|nr:sensor domain-containing diguanylate cyclase [Paramaledivibacter caminithermalis]SHK34118.1 diguanylate cyclase (GGDEF) domain-containing protein [Paramaledivibacter caminithermalis DSM 15212]
MIINFRTLLILLVVAIFANSTLGIFLPVYFHAKNTVLFQIILTSFLSILTAFVALKLINKKLSDLHKIANEIVKENPDTTTNNKNNNHYFKNIYYFLDNIETILKNYNHFITNQNVLLQKFSILNDKLKKSNQVREVMLEVSNSILEINNTEELFKLILEKLISIIDDADKGSFIVLNENNLLEYKAVVGYNLMELKGIQFKLEETFLWKKNFGNITQPCIIKDIRSFDNSHLSDDTYKALDRINALDIKTCLSIPIIIDNILYGMINIDSFNIDAFNEENIIIAEYFSNQVSIAIKNHKLIEKILYLSRYDSMTNTYNRCYFEQLLDKFFKKASRYNESFCIAMFDLNSLKQINDTFGHDVGDTVISKFANVLKDNIRESDLFARYGGDEFIGVFFNSTPKDIRNRLESVIEYFNNNPLHIKCQNITISFSYGITHFPEESKDLNYLIKLADKRMYEYKRISKGKVCTNSK